jgi:hypothetical protein
MISVRSLYFGPKAFEQLLISRHLAEDLGDILMDELVDRVPEALNLDLHPEV